MLHSKIAGIVLAGSVMAGLVFMALGSDPAPATAAGLKNVKQQKVDAKQLSQLLQDRRDTLQKVVTLVEKQYKNGLADAEQLMRAKIQWLESELDLCSTSAQRVDVLTQIVQIYQDQENALARNVKTGDANEIEFSKAKAARLEAQIALTREKLGLTPQSEAK